MRQVRRKRKATTPFRDLRRAALLFPPS